MAAEALPTVRVAEHTLFQDLGNEIVLLNLQSEDYFGLEGSALRIWQLAVEHNGDLEAVVAQMVREFAVDEATVRADIHALVEDLRAADLIETS